MIIARRMLTEPKAALAGVMLETSFARFRASMAIFSVERAPSRLLCFWDPASMLLELKVAARKWRGAEAVRENPNLKIDERPSCHHTSSADRAFEDACDRLISQNLPCHLLAASSCVSGCVSLSTGLTGYHSFIAHSPLHNRRPLRRTSVSILMPPGNIPDNSNGIPSHTSLRQVHRN